MEASGEWAGGNYECDPSLTDPGDLKLRNLLQILVLVGLYFPAVKGAKAPCLTISLWLLWS